MEKSNNGNNNFAILSLVAIVAVIGIVSLVMMLNVAPKSTTNDYASTMSGQAIRGGVNPSIVGQSSSVDCKDFDGTIWFNNKCICGCPDDESKKISKTSSFLSSSSSTDEGDVDGNNNIMAPACCAGCTVYCSYCGGSHTDNCCVCSSTQEKLKKFIASQ